MLKLVLKIVKLLPKGKIRVIRWLAKKFPSLQNYPITLTLLPDVTIQADLREDMFNILWLSGHYPHQYGEDLVSQILITKNDTVWDIGANIGYTALLYSQSTGENGQVEAFEPGSKAFAHLKRTTSNHSNITCYQLGAFDYDGSIKFTESDQIDRSQVANQDDMDSNVVEIQCIKLDTFVRDNPSKVPDIIKIDVEGFESQVIKGATETLKKHSPIIIFEALTANNYDDSVNSIKSSEQKYNFYQIMRSGKLESYVKWKETNKHTHNFVALTSTHQKQFPGDLFSQ